MTTPQQPDGNVAGMVSQVLVEQGKQGIQLAHIEEKLNTVLTVSTDHEDRIRTLEKAQQESQGSKDLMSRWIAFAAVAVAAGSGLAAWFTAVHH